MGEEQGKREEEQEKRTDRVVGEEREGREEDKEQGMREEEQEKRTDSVVGEEREGREEGMGEK